MQIWVFAVLLFPVLNKVNTSPTGSTTDDVMRYSCQNSSMEGMYGCYDKSVLTVDSITYLINDVIQKQRALYKAIDDSTAPVTKETVLQPILDFECTMDPIVQSVLYMSEVAEDKTIRDVTLSMDIKHRESESEISLMKNVFDKLEDLNARKDTWKATEEEARYMTRFLRDRRRKGINLDKNTQLKLNSLNTELSEKTDKFFINLGENTDVLALNSASLKGVSPDFLKSLTKDAQGNYIIDPSGPHYSEIITFCDVEETRKLLYTAWSNRGQKGHNSRLLTDLGKLRKEVASTMGFASYVDFATDILMAKNAATVRKFLQDLADKLRPKLMKDSQEYLKVKLQKCKETQDVCSEQLQMWDYSYVINCINKINYNVDNNLIREYFPLEVVQKKMFNFFSSLLGLKFQKIQQKSWSEDVTSYQVNDKKTGELLGYFFMDLFPREGKGDHAIVSPFQSSCRRPDGSRQVPISILLTNLPRKTPTRPSLLTYSEMKTFFHEFGHLLHSMCTKTELNAFGFLAVETDFLEAPSQMLEHFLLEPAILKDISRHYKNKNQLSDDLIQSIIASENSALAFTTMRQVVFAVFDFNLHVDGTDDVDQLFRDVAKLYMNITIPDNVHFPGTIGHLAGGYAAQYYSYLWSQVYSADMYLTKFNKNSDPKVGREYRRKVLEKGGTKDAVDLLKDFLGREPQIDAFLKLKNLE